MSAGEAGQDLVVERDGGLAVLRLNRPDRLNAISAGMRAQFATEIPRLTAAPDVRAIMITGAGRAFCAGGDIGSMGGKPAHASPVDGLSEYHGWLAALRGSEKIVLSAVNGVAAGGGFGLALVADVVIASDAAYFKAAFTDLGVAADFALGFTLPRLVGEGRAAEILYSDRKVPAHEALAMGMIGRVIPADTFEADALAFAHQLASTARGVQLTKRLLRNDDAEAFAAYLRLEAKTQAEAFGTADAREGIAAFLAKRRPLFQGR